jgi:hypothetical protein
MKDQSGTKQTKTMPSKKRTQPEATVDTPLAPPAEPTVEPPKNPPAKRQRKKKVDAEVSASEVSAVTPSVVSSTASATVKKPRRKKNPDKKSSRTPSSYVLFSMEERKTIVANNPNLNLGEVSKRCGVAWKALSVEDRGPWQKKADELKQKRLAEIAEENKNNPPKKKRAPSSYLLFAMEHRKVVLQDDPSLVIGDVSKKCGHVWKSMTDADKQVWKDKAAELKN